MKWILLTAIIFTMCFFAGCTEPEQPKLETEKARTEVIKFQTMWKTVYKHDWRVTLYSLAIAAGGFLMYTGAVKMGLGIVIASFCGICVLALWKAIAVHPWISQVVALVLLACGVAWFIQIMFFKNRAIKEIVKGGENLKDQLTDAFKDRFRKIQSGVQHPSTEKIVEQEQKKIYTRKEPSW